MRSCNRAGPFHCRRDLPELGPQSAIPETVTNRSLGLRSRLSWITAALAITFSFVVIDGAAAQETPAPESHGEPQGFVAEPDALTRVVLFADRHFGKGDLNNGFYINLGMTPGAGWLSGGPGYRQWFGEDAMLLDASAAYSSNGFKTAQARMLLPTFAKSRLVLGTQVRWIDFGEVDFFGVGPDSPAGARTTYGIEATHVTAHATLRPARWFGIDAEVGLLSPSLRDRLGSVIPGEQQPQFVPAQLSLSIDTRNFRDHPTRGLLLRGAAAHYDDRDGGAFTHRRYEAEAAGFLPLFGERVVMAVRGLAVATPLEDGVAPFYLMPTLGGANSLRSFTDYRFQDRAMLLANAELRLALMTHVDLALFADAGNVAAEIDDVDLDKQSFGAGLRLHTRRQTFGRLDVANGAEGWRVLFRLTDPLALTRVDRRASVAPWVP